MRTVKQSKAKDNPAADFDHPAICFDVCHSSFDFSGQNPNSVTFELINESNRWCVSTLG